MTLDGLSLAFSPLLPVWVIALLTAIGLLLAGWSVSRRARGALWRVLFTLIVAVFLLEPTLVREEREDLADIVLLVDDRTASQDLGQRGERTEAARERLRQHLQETESVELRELTLEGDRRRGSPLMQPLLRALAEVDRSRLAGIITITDGRLHDVPEDLEGLSFDAPFHALITGERGERDRQLVVEQAPSFAVVGEPVELVVRAEALPRREAQAPQSVPLSIRKDGELIEQRPLHLGQDQTIELTLEKAGRSVVELDLATAPDELTDANNRKILSLNGIRDRLRVLLVSGRPYPGLRVWRNLLKADPAVDLVHFTILRPPEKQDGTPIRELALIAFPSRELFEVKLDDFDLIVFDRYSRRGLLPLVYLDNVARYVEEGGAMLEAAGPEFAGPLSLYRTPLSRVLPGRPSGEVFERGYLPSVTDMGGIHPVTRGLTSNEEEERWGRWFRQVDVEAPQAQVLMTGVADRPLLLLERVGEGRIAQLLSDHAWLWARGFEEGGPQAVLLRRLVHWLMREPELEEEALTARPLEDGLEIERRSLDEGAFSIEVTTPSGRTRTVALDPAEDGIARARIDAVEDGLYTLRDGELVAYATPRPIAERELTGMTATVETLAPLAAATGGAVTWLAEDGVPDIRRVDPDRNKSGRGWIGIERNDAHIVTGVGQTSLLPAWLVLLLLIATAAMAWWREGSS